MISNPSDVVLYHDQCNIDKLGTTPFFINGNDLNTNEYSEFITYSFNKSKFLIIQVGKIDSIDIDMIRYAKSENSDICIILLNKEEQFTDKHYEFIDKLKELGFTTNQIVGISSELNNDVFKDILTPTSPKLIFSQYLHNNRNLIPDLYLNKKNKILKTKKIISSARKFNPVRENFYENLSENLNLINNDNSFRYYSLLPNCKSNSDVFDGIYSTFNSYNNSYDEVSTESMIDDEENFYNNLIEEYSNYYFSIIHETLPKSSFSESSKYLNKSGLYPNFPSSLQVGEKTLIPMASQTIFFVSGLPHIERYLKDIGVATFEDIFNVSYDSLNFDEKNKNLIDICKVINNMSYDDIDDLYNSVSVQQKIKTNKEFILYWKNQDNIRNEFFKNLQNIIDNKL